MGALEHAEAVTKKGRLIVYFGPMFSGKSSGMIDEVERSEHAGRKSFVFKPSNDDRYSIDEIVTHSGKRIFAHNIPKDDPRSAMEVLKQFESVRGEVAIVAFDEGQFFEKDEFLFLIDDLLAMGRTVIVAGLPTDGFDDDFGAMPTIIGRADEPIHRTAYCTHEFHGGGICGAVATKTQRLFESTQQVVVGGADMYGARCRDHFVKPPR